MKPIIAALAAAIVLAASQTIAVAANDSTEAAEHHAKADYKAAKKQCKTMSGNDKDVCLKQAKADYTAATEDAKAAMKSDKAGIEATEDKTKAEYKVAKEKCDALSGDAKSACISEAKARYKN